MNAEERLKTDKPKRQAQNRQAQNGQDKPQDSTPKRQGSVEGFMHTSWIIKRLAILSQRTNKSTGKLCPSKQKQIFDWNHVIQNLIIFEKLI